MELRHLRYFVSVAEELNFTRAAERLHIAQPSLSVQIQKLEQEVGAELLARQGRNVRLTEAGRIFLSEARQLLTQAGQSITLARRAANGEIGQLSIGYNTAAECQIFPRIIPAFRERWPEVQLILHNLGIARQLDGLRRNELDLGFVWMLPTDEFDVHKLKEDSLIAALSSKHRLASAASVSIKDLSHEPMVLFSPTLDPATYHQIEQLFLRQKAVMTVAYQVDTLLSMINFVAMGIACSLLPDYARTIHREGIVYKPVRGPNIVKTLAIVKKKGRGDLAERFYRFTAETLAGDRPRKPTSASR